MVQRYLIVESREEIRYVWFDAVNSEVADDLRNQINAGDLEIEDLPFVSSKIKNSSIEYSEAIEIPIGDPEKVVS